MDLNNSCTLSQTLLGSLVATWQLHSDVEWLVEYSGEAARAESIGHT